MNELFIFGCGLISGYLINEINRLRKNDPVHNCKLYREQGCSHVDGFLCDFPYCEMNKQYIKEEQDVRVG